MAKVLESQLGLSAGGHRLLIFKEDLAAGTVVVTTGLTTIKSVQVSSEGTDSVGAVISGGDVTVTSANGADTSSVTVEVRGY